MLCPFLAMLLWFQYRYEAMIPSPCRLSSAGFGVLVLVCFLLRNPMGSHSRFKQFVDYAQLMDVIIRAMPVIGSSSSIQYGSLSIFALNIQIVTSQIAVPCVAPLGPLARQLLIAYGQPGLLVLLWLLLFALLECRCRGRQLQLSKRSFYYAFWQILLLSYSSLNVSGFTLLNCRSVGPHRVLSKDDSVMCSGPGYSTAVVVCVTLSVAVALVLPAFMVYAHHQFRLRVRSIKSVKLLTALEPEPEGAGVAVVNNAVVFTGTIGNEPIATSNKVHPDPLPSPTACYSPMTPVPTDNCPGHPGDAERESSGVVAAATATLESELVTQYLTAGAPLRAEPICDLQSYISPSRTYSPTNSPSSAACHENFDEGAVAGDEYGDDDVGDQQASPVARDAPPEASVSNFLQDPNTGLCFTSKVIATDTGTEGCGKHVTKSTRFAETPDDSKKRGSVTREWQKQVAMC